MRFLIVSFASAMTLTTLIAMPVRRLALYLGAVDRPNPRSSHEVPTPRGGGLAIVLGTSLTVLGLAPPGPANLPAWVAVGAVAAVSLLDDLRSLPYGVRLTVQTVAAALAVIMLHLPVRSIGLPGLAVGLPPPLGLCLASLFIIATCNFYNFMDGINGLAAGQSSVVAAALSALLWRAGCMEAAAVASAVCGAAVGFLPHNFPSARVFMGDVGSVTLGFVLALLSQVAHAQGGTPWVAAVLVHGVFLSDAVFTLLKRALRGEAVVKPHREHGYQLLVRAGWPQTTVTLTVWLLSTVCCLASVLYAWLPGVGTRCGALLVTFIWLAVYIAVSHFLLNTSKSQGTRNHAGRRAR